MTKIILVFATVFAINAQAADQNDVKYFQLAKVKVTEVTNQYPLTETFTQPGLGEDCNPASRAKVLDNGVPSLNPADPLDQISIIIDKIVNIGKKVWAIVETGRPTVHIKTYTANALPQGLKCWSDLTGWQIPQSKVYRVQYENLYGMDVVDFAYRVTFTAGGALKGQGKYITNATIMPADLNVSWGYTFNANAEVPSVFNMGTSEQPVAGMQMVMKWSVDTVMNHAEQAESYYVGGDNTMKQME
ncbi:MAG TPA: hypothetical protein VIG33_17100 [Pseudobdellovibrionaceae bacterium]|jgi:hypothetical protein